MHATDPLPFRPRPSPRPRAQVAVGLMMRPLASNRAQWQLPYQQTAPASRVTVTKNTSSSPSSSSSSFQARRGLPLNPHGQAATARCCSRSCAHGPSFFPSLQPRCQILADSREDASWYTKKALVRWQVFCSDIGERGWRRGTLHPAHGPIDDGTDRAYS